MPAYQSRARQLNNGVRYAASFSDLVRNWERVDPDLAEALKGKPLILSKTPWGVIVCYILGLALGHFGIEMSDAGTQVLAGVFVLIGSYAMRYITTARINGIVKPNDTISTPTPSECLHF